MTLGSGETQKSRTASEAGWHVSRYNLYAEVPETNKMAIANIFKGTCAEYVPLEMYLLSIVGELDENHPIIERFAKRGVICNFDERAALESMGGAACALARGISLTICPTMGCNFDCPYCFEDHGRGTMPTEVQDDVVALAERMLNASGSKDIGVTWFGGEPLLAPRIIESLSERLMALTEERGGTYRASIITNGYLLTQDIVDMLQRCKVDDCQITIDGLGSAHDATRHLAGGGATFDRIAANLRHLKIPFRVRIRHNVHEGNKNEMAELEEFIGGIASESGNDLFYYPALVTGNETADKRDGRVGLLCGTNASEVAVQLEAGRFSVGRGNYCGAQSIWSVGIDECGNLQKCWEASDKTHLSFGTAHSWDPANPLVTATSPDNLTMFLNTASPVPDDECRECKWLPLCVGGCPYARLFTARSCIAFKDDEERYVLALHARIGEKKKYEEETARQRG